MIINGILSLSIINHAYQWYTIANCHQSMIINGILPLSTINQWYYTTATCIDGYLVHYPVPCVYTSNVH